MPASEAQATHIGVPGHSVNVIELGRRVQAVVDMAGHVGEDLGELGAGDVGLGHEQVGAADAGHVAELVGRVDVLCRPVVGGHVGEVRVAGDDLEGLGLAGAR